MYKASDVKSKYGYDPMPLDLSRIPDWERFVQAMNYAMMKQFSAMGKKKGKRRGFPGMGGMPGMPPGMGF